MASEFFGYFDSVEGDVRDYNATDLSRGFRIMCDTGVATLENDNLKVIPAESGLRTKINYGGALIYGFPYELIDDGGDPRYLDHAAAVSYPRIDRVVLRLDRAAGQRRIQLAVIQGEEAVSPVPPELTRSMLSDGTTYEISLAQVRVGTSATLFQEGDITDERGDPAVCGNIRRSLSELDGVVPIASGGTGQTTVAAARNALGLGDTTGAVPIANGGTGQTTVALARNALGLGNTAGPLPAANGGTGLTSLQAARNGMGLGNTLSYLPIANGGTAANTAAGALTNLGVRRNGNTSITVNAGAVLSFGISFSPALPSAPLAVVLTLGHTSTMQCFAYVTQKTAQGISINVNNTGTASRTLTVNYIAML